MELRGELRRERLGRALLKSRAAGARVARAIVARAARNCVGSSERPGKQQCHRGCGTLPVSRIIVKGERAVRSAALDVMTVQVVLVCWCAGVLVCWCVLRCVGEEVRFLLFLPTGINILN